MHFASHGHAHAHPAAGGFASRTLRLATLATLALVLVELTAGYLGHSVALVSDGIHNLSDVPTLIISWLALVWNEKPPTPEKTFGYRRAGFLAAFTNALLLIGVAGVILWESVERMQHPVAVRTGLMMGVSLAALAVNGGITLALVRGRSDLNLRSVLVHNAGDAVSNVAILLGALAIRWTGAHRVDAALGLAIGLLIVWSSIGILRDSSHVLLEGLPRALKLEDVARAMLRIEGVEEVHDVHIWTVGTDLLALSCHIRIPDMHMEESARILAEIHRLLEEEFHITHSTIQFERAGLPTGSGLFMPEPYRSDRS